MSADVEEIVNKKRTRQLIGLSFKSDKNQNTVVCILYKLGKVNKIHHSEKFRKTSKN